MISCNKYVYIKISITVLMTVLHEQFTEKIYLISVVSEKQWAMPFVLLMSNIVNQSAKIYEDEHTHKVVN